MLNTTTPGATRGEEYILLGVARNIPHLTKEAPEVRERKASNSLTIAKLGCSAWKNKGNGGFRIKVPAVTISPLRETAWRETTYKQRPSPQHLVAVRQSLKPRDPLEVTDSTTGYIESSMPQETRNCRPEFIIVTNVGWL